ncbi:MAG TPA: tellurite resistance protein TerY [Planctomycetaceae bacterium]|nr:tellurite resistance protein TerY [Planctomycetaceae bacterium]
MNNLAPFTRATQRMLPVILLADVSGSMDGEKIALLNRAVREMLETFRDDRTARAEIHVSVITFGGVATVHQPLAPAREVNWVNMNVSGNTPLGAALELAESLIENKDALPSNAYRPTIILVSDGYPNDSWELVLDRFNAGRRTGKTQRLAMAIGSDADEGMLRRFLNGGEEPLFRAGDASQIAEFFRYVSQSVATRSRAADPNKLPQIPRPADMDEF